jgi:hypothetical protein
LQNHTGFLTAGNTIIQSQHNLKLAQGTSLVSDADRRMPFGKDVAFAPPAISSGALGSLDFFFFWRSACRLGMDVVAERHQLPGRSRLAGEGGTLERL